MKYNTLIKYSFSLMVACSSVATHAQFLDGQASNFDLPSDKYLRFYYDNDLFVGRDEQYTQGFALEFFHPNIEKALLVRLKRSLIPDAQKFGLRFSSFVYTPASIVADSILKGDRPYSGNFQIGLLRNRYFKGGKTKVNSYFFVGMIGPAGFGNPMQTGIHTLTGNDLPQGWKYQIKNEPITGYRLRLEQNLTASSSWFGLSPNVQFEIGTLKNNASIGIDTRIGRKTKTDIQNKNNFYLYTQTWLHAVGYDATLQGGIFVKNSPYTIRDSQIARGVLEQHIGFNLQVARFQFAFDFGLLTKEFSTGQTHLWGGIRLGRTF